MGLRVIENEAGGSVGHSGPTARVLDQGGGHIHPGAASSRFGDLQGRRPGPAPYIENITAPSDTAWPVR